MFEIYSSQNEYIPSRKHENYVQENVEMELNFMVVERESILYSVEFLKLLSCGRKRAFGGSLNLN